MVVAKSWEEIHRTRFPELVFDCGNDSDPGVIYSDDLRDWSDKETTPDQYRIERYIDRYDLRDKRLLHIGVGNSGLARRFRNRVKEIVGTTIDQPEIDVARSLRLTNYSVVLHNKYHGGGEIAGKFDFIVDNNPTSPCCCLRHLAALLDFYVVTLAEGGQIVTDREGLEWVPEESNPRWSFSFDDLAAVARLAGLSAYRVDRSVFVLSRDRPRPAELLSVARHKLRRLSSAPARIVKFGPGKARRLFHRTAGRLLRMVRGA